MFHFHIIIHFHLKVFKNHSGSTYILFSKVLVVASYATKKSHFSLICFPCFKLSAQVKQLVCLGTFRNLNLITKQTKKKEGNLQKVKPDQQDGSDDSWMSGIAITSYTNNSSC